MLPVTFFLGGEMFCQKTLYSVGFIWLSYLFMMPVYLATDLFSKSNNMYILLPITMQSGITKYNSVGGVSYGIPCA